MVLELLPGARDEAAQPQSWNRYGSGASARTEATAAPTRGSCSFSAGSLSFPADSTPGREGLQRTGAQTLNSNIISKLKKRKRKQSHPQKNQNLQKLMYFDLKVSFGTTSSAGLLGFERTGRAQVQARRP